MRKINYSILLVFVALFSFNTANAQVPVQFLVNTPASIAGAYEHGEQADFGPELTETVTGDLQWAYDDGMYDGDGDGQPDPGYADSMNCSWNTTDAAISGKVAFIRRGACFFSQKIYNVQDAGAIGAVVCNNLPGDGIIGMSGADSMEAVVIPGVFLSYEDCDLIDAQLMAGETVSVSFYVPSMYQAYGAYAYSTPESQILALENMAVNLVNNSTQPEADVVATATITDPNGTETVLTSSIGAIGGLIDTAVAFDPYTPTMKGAYEIKYEVSTSTGNSNLGNDILYSDFIVSDKSYTVDNYDVLPGGTGLAPAEQTYLDAFFRYDMGAFYLAGPAGGSATYMSFGLANPADLPVGDVFSIILYDADPDGDGTVDGASTYDDFAPVAVAEHTLTGAEVANEQIYLPLLDINTGSGIVPLAADGQYVLMVQYDGTSSGNVVPPAYTDAGIIEYPYFASLVYLDQLYTAGWASNRMATIRLHMDGFDPLAVNVEDLGELEASKFSVLPTLADEVVTLTLDLADVSEKVYVSITNVQGQSVASETYTGVQTQEMTYNVSDFAAGTYFMSVATDEGVTTKRFVVSH